MRSVTSLEELIEGFRLYCLAEGKAPKTIGWYIPKLIWVCFISVGAESLRRLRQGFQAQDAFGNGDFVVETRFAEASQGWPNSSETHPNAPNGLSEPEPGEHVCLFTHFDA